ncbi:MAG: class I SAM-dependent methyltransferase [Defluviitaleaceae bacterium]|nr:class I SAM-dependent methyltransferase [Defluviitaleaceae bacterium]
MMHLAEGWRDYTLLDAGGGEKLEKWGDVTVIRPDPQAFWPRSPKADWDRADMYYHRSKAGGGSWEILSKNVPEAWQIGYKGLKFHIRPTGFKHMGLFPEQAVNWQWLGDKLKDAHPQPKVLNLFAYTGGATLACLKAGANVTHIDAAKGMNRWAKDNIALSNLSQVPHRIMEDDALKFVLREGRRGSLYDGIIMDPPVFGRGPGGEMWKLEERLYELVEACVKILSPSARFMLINAYTAGFSPTVYGNILSIATKKPGVPDGHVSVGEIGLPAKSGVTLPCGMYARWES